MEAYLLAPRPAREAFLSRASTRISVSYAQRNAACSVFAVQAMTFKLFRTKPSTDELRPRFEPDPSLAEALARRVNEIDFQPSKGFLKDRPQPKRSASRPNWARK